MSPFFPLLVFLLIIPNTPASLSDSETFEGCSSSFRCGPRFTAGYPFWGGDRPDYCGHPDLKLICEDHHKPSIFINEVQYIVVGINNESQTLRMARPDYQEGYCDPTPMDTALLSPLLELSPEFEMVTFHYDCLPPPSSVKGGFTCSYEHGFVKPGVDGPEHCISSVTVPINKSYIPTGLEDLSVVQQGLREGFEVRWKVRGIGCKECLKSNGSCGYSREENQTVCFCRNQQSEMLTACPDFEEASASSGMAKWFVLTHPAWIKI